YSSSSKGVLLWSNSIKDTVGNVFCFTHTHTRAHTKTRTHTHQHTPTHRNTRAHTHTHTHTHTGRVPHTLQGIIKPISLLPVSCLVCVCAFVLYLLECVCEAGV